MNTLSPLSLSVRKINPPCACCCVCLLPPMSILVPTSLPTLTIAGMSPSPGNAVTAETPPVVLPGTSKRTCAWQDCGITH